MQAGVSTIKVLKRDKTRIKGRPLEATSYMMSGYSLTEENIPLFTAFAERMLCSDHAETSKKAVMRGLQIIRERANAHLSKASKARDLRDYFERHKGSKQVESSDDLQSYFEFFANPSRAESFWFFDEARNHLGGTEEMGAYRLPYAGFTYLEDFRAIEAALQWKGSKLSAALVGIAINEKTK